MRSDLFSRISWLVVILATLILIVYILGKAASAVPFPSAEIASTTQQLIQGTYSITSIKAPLGTITVMIASTSEQQSLGLGGRDSLPANEGMLFPFASPGRYGFWMKDMRFSLDMVWIAPDKSVMAVIQDISPATYPEVLYPPGDISYVLELNADSAVKFGIATSTKLVF